MGECDFLLKHGENKIELLPGVKNVLIYAYPNDPKTYYFGRPWLLIVSNVTAGGNGEYFIYRIASFSIDTHTMYANESEDVLWGNTKHYDFFLATDEQKKFFAKELAKMGFKYISSLKKIIKR